MSSTKSSFLMHLTLTSSTLSPLGPPDALKNCTVLNESTDSVQVACDEGFDGGLPQSFIMEVYETEGHKLKVRHSSGSGSGSVCCSSSSSCGSGNSCSGIYV